MLVLITLPTSGNPKVALGNILSNAPTPPNWQCWYSQAQPHAYVNVGGDVVTVVVVVVGGEVVEEVVVVGGLTQSLQLV